MKKILRGILSIIAAIGLIGSMTGATAWASNAPSFTQVINAGTLTTDIRDASGNSVASPSYAMSPLVYSFMCQTSTGTLGSNTQRLYVTNPGAASNGWTLAIAATNGSTALWSNSGNTQHIDYNDPTSSGCTDGTDADTYAGQMTLNPSAATLTPDCNGGCTTTGITQGSATAFSEGTTNSITLLTASASASAEGQWYLTGVGVSQTIPAQQAIDSYSINLTATVTAS